MIINFTNNETVKIANTIKMFGVPDIDIEKVTDEVNHWSETPDNYKYEWGSCTKGPDGVTLNVNERYTCRALEATTIAAPAVNKLIGVLEALKPICKELSELAGKVSAKLDDVFADRIQHSVYYFSANCNTYLLVVSRNDYGTDCGEYFSVQGPERYVERRMTMSEAIRFVDDRKNAIDPIASDAGTTKYNNLTREEREDMYRLLDKATTQFIPEDFKKYIESHRWMTIKDAVHSYEAQRVLAKLKEEEAKNKIAK